MIAAEQIQKLLARIAFYDDAHAYKELFLSYHRKLVKFATAITHSKESAEEVVSDVFLKLWVNRTSLPAVENFHLYLYIATKNSAINRYLKDGRHPSFSLDAIKMGTEHLALDPEQLLITAEMNARIHAAVRELPPRCQLIFKLIKEDGLSYRETADLLDLSLKTVENQMTIAFRKIGESIQADWLHVKLN